MNVGDPPPAPSPTPPSAPAPSPAPHTAPTPAPWFLRSITPLLWSVLGLRLALFFGGVLALGLAPETIARGHDGYDYVVMAQKVAAKSIETIPEHFRRHDIGYPLLISSLTLFPTPAFAAVIMGWLLVVALAIMIYQLCLAMKLTSAQGILLAAAATVTYPTQLYYGMFALSESAFTILLLAALNTWIVGAQGGLGHMTGPAGWIIRRWGWRVPVYFLVGLAGMLRAPGLLLGIAMMLVDLRSGIAVPKILSAAVAPLPWFGTLFITHAKWGKTAAGYHTPTFGLPFSGFGGISEVSTVRAVYVCAAVAFFVVSAILLTRQLRTAPPQQSSPQDPAPKQQNFIAREFLRVAVVFAWLFLAFHLCLKSLFYEGRTIATFNYQDRYLLPLLPVAVFAWRGLLRPRPAAIAAIALLAATSLALSAWWLVNYTRAAGLTL